MKVLNVALFQVASTERLFYIILLLISPAGNYLFKAGNENFTIFKGFKQIN